ncbi:MAG: sugar phosphate nucleotidyltransferase [Promethearchaeota archaeon]
MVEMKEWSAVILAGGLGTRLMPLTTYICKPMVSVTNKPMIDYAIDHLRYAGIKHIIVCVKKFGDLLKRTLLERWQPVMDEDPEFRLEIPFNESHGTADAVRQIWDLIDTDNFIISMADIITNLPMKKFASYHLEKKADATISMKQIDEFATKYGNTVIDKNGRIKLFLEKPSAQELFLSTLTGSQNGDLLPIINTGIYCFNRECAKHAIMETNFMDFGKEIFPYLLENNFKLFGFVENYYWMDVGNPKTYLWANWDILREYGWPILPKGKDELNQKIWWFKKPITPPSTVIKAPCSLGRNIYFGENVLINSLTVIGSNVKIGNGTIISQSVIWDNVEIGENCNISNSIIADNCKIGNNVTIRSEAVIGPNCVIKDGVLIDSQTIDADRVVEK